MPVMVVVCVCVCVRGGGGGGGAFIEYTVKILSSGHIKTSSFEAIKVS